MKIYLLPKLMLVALLTLIFVNFSFAQEDITSDITSDVTWFSGTDYRIGYGSNPNIITIRNGATLTIQPGVTVFLDSAASLIVGGTTSAQVGELIAIGTEQDSILFTQTETGVYHAGIRFTRYSSDNSVMAFCKIMWGFANALSFPFFHGGAILIIDSSPTIQNCLVANNKAIRSGGGIYLVAQSENGANVNPSILNNIIQNDTSYYSGGGIAVVSAGREIWGTIKGNIIENCYSGLSAGSYGGGGIWLDAAANGTMFTVIDSNIIRNNSGDVNGGGIYIDDDCTGAIEISRNIIQNNEANFGGGINLSINNNPLIYSNLILDNIANSDGGGFYCSATTGVNNFYNNVIYGNSANDHGGGCALFGTDNAIYNSIIYNNTQSTGFQMYNEGDSTNFCVIEDGITGGTSGPGTVIGLDPEFTDVFNSDFSLTITSPLIDAGYNINAPSRDFLGKSMPFDGDRDSISIVDIGAYEYHNTIPTITSDPVLSVLQDDLYSYQVTGSDLDNDPLFFLLEFNPEWLGIDSFSGLISGTPGSSDVGDTTVVISINDYYGGSAQQIYNLEVINVNDPPVITSSADSNANENELYTYVLEVNDPDVNDVLTFTLLTHPHWLSIDSTGTISGTPLNADVGDTVVVVEVMDNSGESDSQTYALTVLNVTNVAPEIMSVPDTVILEDELYSYQIIVTDGDLGDQIHYQLLIAPEWLNIDSSGLISGTALNENVGESILSTRVFDNYGGADTQSYTLIVENVNDEPILFAPIDDIQLFENDSLYFVLPDSMFYDVDINDSLNYSVTLSDSSDLPPWLLFIDSSLTFTGCPSNEDVGLYPVRISVTDKETASAYDDFIIEVLNINDPPTIAQIPLTLINEDDSVQVLYDYLFDFITDIDNQQSSLSLDLSSSENITITADTTSFNIKLNLNWNGIDTLLLIVSDGQYSDSADFIVSVKAINDAPTILPLPEMISFLRDSSYVLSFSEYGTDVDSPDSLLSWTFTTSNDNALTTEYDSSKMELKLSSNDLIGDFYLYCMLADDSLASSLDSILVRILLVNNLTQNPVNEIPSKFQLHQNFPNPFNPVTTIKFDIPENSQITIKVFNILGQEVITLINKYMVSGYHQVAWGAVDKYGRDVGSGLYFYRLESSKFTKIMRMVLIR